MLRLALHDRWMVDLGDGGIMLVAGIAAIAICRTPRHRLAAWMVCGSLFGILCLGALTGYIRSYHLRILAVPIAVAAGMGFARLWPVAIAAAGVFTWQLWSELPVGADNGALARADRIAASIPDGPVWVDRLWWSGSPKVDASAVVLSGLLAGRTDHALGSRSRFVLLTSGQGPVPATHLMGEDWAVVLFDSSTSAQAWLDRQTQIPHQVGGAYDWATVLNPDTTLEDSHW
jgi:hypothetical protein